MAVNIELVAEKAFNLLAGSGYDILSLNSAGETVIDPTEASRFVIKQPNILVRLDKATETVSMGVREDFDNHDLRDSVKHLANDYLMNFDFKIFGKVLKPKSETIDIAQKSEKPMGDVLEALNTLKQLAGLPVDTISEFKRPTTSSTHSTGKDKKQYDPAHRHTRPVGGNPQVCPKCKGDGCSACSNTGEVISKLRNDPKVESDLNEFQNDLPGYHSYKYPMAYTFIINMAKGQLGEAERNWFFANFDDDESMVQAIQTQGLSRDKSFEALKAFKADLRNWPGSMFEDKAYEGQENMKNTKEADIDESNFTLSNYGTKCPKCGKVKGGETLDIDKVPGCECPEEPEDVKEGFSSMSGSSKTSYQGLDNVKLIVRHKKEVNEEIRGSRSRNIHSIFIQRGDERFKMAETNLKAARAMARHVKNGGEPFDSVGSAINEMATEQRKLREFVRYVKTSGLVNEENESYVALAVENIDYITKSFTKLAGVKSYANATEQVLDRSHTEVLQDDIDLESKFTETHFDNKVANVIDSIKTAMSRRTSFESIINTAVTNETFASLKSLLSEDDGMEFATPYAKLGHQVGQMSTSVTNSHLGNYLSGISKKLNNGDRMSQHEYTTIKSCLLGAHQQHEVPVSVAESVEDQYEQFIEQFDIL